MKIESINNFSRIEERFKAAIQKRKDQLNYLPPPPIPDGEGIFALRTVAEQNSWAKRQQNCIRNYDYQVKSRKCHMYRIILNNEEATLEILIKEDKLNLGQLKGFKNSDVSEELREHVKKWFEINKNSGQILKRITLKRA